MNKKMLVRVLVVGLLVSNLLLLVSFVSGRTPARPARHPEPKARIIKTLQFDEAQVAAYAKLIEVHQADIKANNKAIQAAKGALYATLASDEVPQALQDSLFTQLAQLQREAELTHYRHFEDIRGLCTPEQQPAFRALTGELLEVFPGRRRPRHPPKRR